MTLLVDRRKDNYDDLLILARDARVSRARVNRWTTGLVLGAMAAMGAYVATVNQEVDQLREAAQEAGEQRDTIKAEYAKLMDDRNALKTQMDVFARYEDMYADIAPALILGDRFKDIALNVSGTTPVVRPVTNTTVQPVLSNLVWIVDGSRRFPITSGDILWIPEGKFWVRMEKPASGEKPNRITVHQGNKPVEPTNRGIEHTFAADSLDPLNFFEIRTKQAVPSGVANCIKLTYHKDSSRAGFAGEEFVDIEVLFSNNPACPERQFDSN